MRIQYIARSAMVAAIALLLTGCIGYYHGEETAMPMWEPGDGVPWELKDVSWALMQNGEVVQSNDETVTLTFSDDRVSGYLGCNGFTADLTMVAENSFKIGSITRTKVLCRDMSAEKLLMSRLPGPHVYEIFENKLLLFLPDKSEPPVLTFSRIVRAYSTDRVSE